MDDATFVLPITPVNQYLNPQGYTLASRYSQYQIQQYKIQFHPGNGYNSSGMSGAVITEPIVTSTVDNAVNPIYDIALGQNHNLRQCSKPWQLKCNPVFLKRYNNYLMDSADGNTSIVGSITMGTDMQSTQAFGGFFDTLKGILGTVCKIGYNLLTP